MRFRILFISALWILVSSFASAQVTWTGGGDGTSWNDAANWSSGLIPAVTDDVILDNTAILTSYDVNLPTGSTTVTVNSIEISPATGNTIRLILPAANTSAMGFIVTSTADAMTMNSGGSFINASASDVELNGNLIIGSGGSIDVSSGTGSPATNIKGNIVISASAAGAITESGTGNPVIELNGNTDQTITSATGALTGDNLDFVVNTTGTVSLLSSVFLPHGLNVQGGTIDISNSAANYTLGIKGDLTISGTITESGMSTLSRILLNGTTNQNITVTATGSITGDQLDFRLNNPAGAMLLSDLVLPGSYTIAGGNLTLGNYSLTTSFINLVAAKATNHIITNGTGFVIIPNIGLSVYTFYVGVDAFSVNEVAISNGSGLTYSVRVAPGINPAITTPFEAIDRTWTINTNSAAANPVPANVTLYYYTGQEGPDFNFSSSIDVGQFLPSAWNLIAYNQPQSTNPPEYRVSIPVNSFNTPFIVGNHGAILPIDFAIICKGSKKDDGAVINWDVYSEENVLRYEVEQATNGNDFMTIAVINPGNEKLSYAYNNKHLAGGTSVYRIKVILMDGKVRYSNTVAILFNVKSFLITSVAPNPVQSGTKITISSPENTSVKMMLYDLQGKMVNQWQQALSDGTNIITLQASSLKAGIYFLSATDGSTKTNTIRILKQ